MSFRDWCKARPQSEDAEGRLVAVLNQKSGIEDDHARDMGRFGAWLNAMCLCEEPYISASKAIVSQWESSQ